MSDGIVAIRIRRGDMVFHVHGERAGAEGFTLAERQVQGIYDAPVKTTWKGGANQVGSRYKGKRRPARMMMLGFHGKETANSWEFNDSAFRQAFQEELDPWDPLRTPTNLEVVTELSGTRKLDIFLFEEPQFTPDVDPLMQQYGNIVMNLIAGQPDWYEDDYQDTFTSTATSASGSIMVENPTDRIAYQRFVLTRAIWSLPDPQWVGAPAERMPGGAQAARMVEGINIRDVNGGAIVDWDKSQLPFRDANNTNLQGQIGQRFLVFPIPPHTPPTPLPISYTDAPEGGAMARLVIPRRWSRPWGMELQTSVSYQPPLGMARFMTPGTWSYEIPPDATHLDVIMLGGGGGGDASGLVIEEGGSAAAWQSVTLVRGENLPASATMLYGQVGAGGKGGQKDTWAIGPGLDGGPSTCSATGMADIVAAGGRGGGHGGHPSGDDVSGPLDFNGVRYTGGKTQTILGAAGNAPGGGGAAGLGFSSGGDGARGQVWIRAYRESSG